MMKRQLKPPKRLTDTYLKSLREPGEADKLDIKVPGKEDLYIRRRPTGTLTWRFRFYPHGGVERVVFVFGNYPEISIKTANDMHADARADVAKGLDPRLEHKRRLRESALKQVKELEKGKIGIRRVIAEWAWHYARRHRKRPLDAVRTLKANLIEPWKGKAVPDLKKRDAVELLDAVVKRDSPVMANRLCDLCRHVFTVCVERDLIENNPFLGIHDPGGEEEPRERCLEFEEIRIVWTYLNRPAETNPMSRRLALALMLLIVTGQRTQEVVKARVAEFDLVNKTWSIPPEHQKTERKPRGGSKKAKKKAAVRVKRVHIVPLSDLAIEIVKELIALAGDSERLLPNRRKHMNPNKPANEKVLYHALTEEIVRDKDGDPVSLWGLDPFAPHDFRRSAATGMTSLGVPESDVSKVLNHSSDDGRKQTTTRKVYDKYKYMREKRRALDTWAKALRDIIAGREPTHLLDEAA